MRKINLFFLLSSITVYDLMLLGSFTRIPKVQKILSDLFGNSAKVITSPESDEAFVCGAAVQAFILSGGKSAKTNVIPVQNKLLCGLSIRNANDSNKEKTIFDAGILIPAEKAIPLSNLRNEGFKVIQINYCEGTLDLSSIPVKSSNVANTKIIFSIDSNSVLTVWAKVNNANERIPLNTTCAINLKPTAVTKMATSMSHLTAQREKQKTQPETSAPSHDTPNEHTAAMQAQQAEIARLTNENRELLARADAMQRNVAMEATRMVLIAGQKMIQKEENEQRAKHAAAEGRVRCELRAACLAHLEWTNDQKKKRQHIETQETAERGIMAEAMAQKLVVIQQVAREQLAIAQQQQMEQHEITRHELQRQSSANAILRRQVARDALEKYAWMILSVTRGASAARKLEKRSIQQISSAANSALNWLTTNPEAALTECEQRLDALKKACAPIEALMPRSAESAAECDE